MSTILNNVFDLLFEAEIELDDKYIDLYNEGTKEEVSKGLVNAGKAIWGGIKKGHQTAVDYTSDTVIPGAVKAGKALGSAGEHIGKGISKEAGTVKKALTAAKDDAINKTSTAMSNSPTFRDLDTAAKQTGQAIGRGVDAVKDDYARTKIASSSAHGSYDRMLASGAKGKSVPTEYVGPNVYQTADKVKKAVGDVGDSSVLKNVKNFVKQQSDAAGSAARKADNAKHAGGYTPVSSKPLIDTSPAAQKTAKAASEHAREAARAESGQRLANRVTSNSRFDAQHGLTPSGRYVSGDYKDGAVVRGLKWAGDNSATIAAVSGGLLGAGLLAKYSHSIMRGKYLVNHYGKLASSAKDPASKAKYTEKLNWAKNKLASAQAKARSEHKGFIEKSQMLKSKISQLQKSGRKDEAAKLSAKLAKRQKFLSKIGAHI